ncbi:MAG TPA: protein kinase [Terriglobales bacterium]|jgi:serine/threonine protein kinase
MASPAFLLEGLTVGDWIVGSAIPRRPGATGGNFSCCYPVTHKNGTKGFLKALDFSTALAALDPVNALKLLTEAYDFERTVLRDCKARRMDRVVVAVEDGKVQVNSTAVGVVPYLIFEAADRDLRAQLSAMSRVDLAWKLRSLHHMATGLRQLHRGDTAHQDLKPSNVLVFGGNVSKIADMGCASRKGSVCPRDHLGIAGDPAYAPPELFYGYQDPEWSLRRLGCDVYLLGSMTVFLFTSLSMTSLLFTEVSPAHRPASWSGTYRDVLPYLIDAFDRALTTFASQIGSDALAQELRTIAWQLCHPDPSRRGHPRNRVGVSVPLGLERYVTQFDLLATKARLGIFNL